MKPVVRNIQNDQLYFFNGGNSFTNIQSGKVGEVNGELAQKIFRFNIQATEIINEYPIVEKMIKILKLNYSK